MEFVRETTDETDRLLLIDPLLLLLLLMLMTVAPERTGFVLMDGFCPWDSVLLRTRLLVLLVTE